MDFLKEKWFLDFIIPIISIIVTYFVKKYILSVFDKQDINNILSNVRNAYKDQLEIFKISKESGAPSGYLNESIDLYINAERWQQWVVKSVPTGKGQKSLLQLDPYITGERIFSCDNEDRKPLDVPEFTNSLEILIFCIGMVVSCVLVLFSALYAFVIFYEICNGADIFNITMALFVCIMYIISAIILFMGIDSISFRVSGAILADIFYRKIAYKNGKDLEESSKTIRANRIRAAASDKSIEDYVYIPKMGIKFLGLGKMLPNIPFVRSAIVRVTSYGYIKGIEDKYIKNSVDNKSYKISAYIVKFLNLQDLTIEEE